MNKKPSPTNATIDLNSTFVDACSNGDYQTVLTILTSLKEFNIDVTDNLGRTALRLAVANEHVEVVLLLLAKCDASKMKEALLFAIFLGHTSIAQVILNHPQYREFNEKKFVNGATDSFWQPQTENSQFSPDITPIILASQYNRTEIVQLLLLNGDRIEKPHEFYCKCNECSNRVKFDSLRHARSRLNAYRGLGSESYIALASIDPILTAFEMAFELKILSEREKYFKGEYLELAANLSAFTVKLLNNVRGRDELEIVLNKIGKENEEKYKRLARLDLAIKYKEMPFVAHPNCQQKLVEIWNTGLRITTKWNQLQSLLFHIALIFFIPVGSLIYMVAPNSKPGKFMCLPYIKFFSHTISYITFIIMVLISSLMFPINELGCQRFSAQFAHYYENYSAYASNEHYRYRFTLADFTVRQCQLRAIDVAVCVWLLGVYVREAKQCVYLGMKDYISAWGNIITLFMGVLFTGSFGLKYYTFLRVQSEQDAVNSDAFWEHVAHMNESDLDAQQHAYETFYWLNNDRFYWSSLDPINLAEALYSLAIIISFAKLYFWLPASQSIGPLQITLGRMISDIGKFFSIFVLVFGGFVFGITALYWYYNENVRHNYEVEPHEVFTKGEESFSSIGLALKTMIFAIYALGADDDPLLEPFQNQLTPILGLIMFALFHVVNITILISMLVAMLTTSFEAIQEHSDVEWKFSRSRLYMEFIKESSALPVPLNIIPTPAIVWYWIRMLFFRGNKHAGEDPSFAQEMHQRVKNELKYQTVLERVAKRFLLHNNRESMKVTENDFDELKEDVLMVKYDMMNDLKKVRENMTRYASIVHSGITLLGNKLTRTKHQQLHANKSKSHEHRLTPQQQQQHQHVSHANDDVLKRYEKFKAMEKMLHAKERAIANFNRFQLVAQAPGQDNSATIAEEDDEAEDFDSDEKFIEGGEQDEDEEEDGEDGNGNGNVNNNAVTSDNGAER